ncbi:MAG: GDP-mannose 4,6-dehydratase [Candidatus Omnitrophica bacterium]|nr:GDP-mannose 4,6-dehydratase [Candidatus Omnitrophota bacterium]
MAENNFWQDRRVFVTGASGLLGSWLVKDLLSLKADVIALVRDHVAVSPLFDDAVKSQITIVNGCVEDVELMIRILNEYEIETVFHLAAQTIVTIALREPVSTFTSNIAGTWCVLEACRRVKTVKRVVTASSDKVYGEQRELPYNESMPLLGQNPYEISKVCADMIARDYAKTYGLPVVVARCGNLFGGGDFNWNRIIPGTIRAALRGTSPVIRTDGTLVRDYFYVRDAVAAYLQLAQNAHREELRGMPYNFSEGRPMSVAEICRETLRVCGRQDIKIVIEGQPTSEIRKQWLDSSKAQEDLKWKMSYGLEKGLTETFGWYKKYFSGEYLGGKK